MWNIDKFAERKYDETGNLVFKAIAKVINPERGLGVGVTRSGNQLTPTLIYKMQW